jgi:hypothetical protein
MLPHHDYHIIAALMKRRPRQTHHIPFLSEPTEQAKYG